ncbi:neoverrucotoxin subunit beta-like [Tachysurus fulvidraco]|uniref:neoverrucotoxin subunit beta-like n=1 Tax=Tachysurus fulvidraco TaxID=1234273 RepID=UPI001FF05783|nr:neoverrucotoxin subunit beta-like [Tachysurus fulvidraco]
MDSRCMVIAALGRPLYPGMLYDCRNDSFIPGVTLWDKNALSDDLDVHQKPKTHLKFAASDSLSDKANLLDVNASLKASFLCGLVEVGGSAKYLQDTKSSSRQSRVTMQYSQTATFEQLTMKKLGNITYPQVFDQKTATHVVTAVLYGAQVFMVFDYTSAENERKQNIEGNLHAVVKKIPTISIEGQASLNMTEDEKTISENISVTFYGDIKLEENPTTYKDALEVYKKVPALMKQQGKGVPLTVWLYPLNLLDDKAAKLMREIDLSLLYKAESLLEEFGEKERICNDLIKRQITDDFPDLKNRLLKFQTLHRNYTSLFKNALLRVLPAIRGGTQEDKRLGDILSIHYTSPFNISNMNKWLDYITTELNILSSYTACLKDITVVKSSGSLNSICFHPDVDVVICLSFTSLKHEDSYLAALQDFANSESFKMLVQTSERVSILQAEKHWFTSPDSPAIMKQNLSLFTSFLKANKNEKRVKFIIASISDPSNPGSSIQLYQNGSLTDPKFQPVSKPPKPEVETSYESVTLKLSKSPTGETVHFRVEYRMTSSKNSAADVEEWTVRDMSREQNTFTLTGLKPTEQYWVRYRAVSDVGVSEASDSVPFTFQGKLTVTVDQWNFSMLSLITELRTEIMTTIGMSRWSPSTIKSEVTNIVNNPTIPYTEKIPGGLREGKALYFQGVVFSNGQSFTLDFVSDEGDVAFHFRPSFNEHTCCNSFVNKKWQDEERVECNISKGSAFDIFVVIKTEGYEVNVNWQKSFLFSHRIPMAKVNAINIHGDVKMNTVGTVANWSKSTFGKELKTTITHTKLSDIQSNVPHPVCNPSKPYLRSIPGGLRPGLALFFQGVVPSDCKSFEINFQTSPTYEDDIAFHFSPRISSVVLNTRRNGTWDQNWVETPGGPFVCGAAFDIIMVVKSECYEVMVNGQVSYTFEHRIPVDKVTTLNINGDVFMNSFAITEVDDMKLKVTVTNPANI